MISWTTAREVAFEKVCSTTGSEEATEYAAGNFGTPTFFAVTRASTTGQTENATGYTQSSSASGSTFTEVPDVYSTYTYTTNFFPVQTETASSSTAGFTIDTSESTSFSTSGSYTVSAQTTITETFEVYGSTTSSSTQQSFAWTTELNEESTSKTNFVFTSAVSSAFFVDGTTLTRTRTVVTESDTTVGNAQDTIYLAESNEVLWVVNENPAWSEPLTDNAISTTQTTVSASVATVGLVAAVSEQTIESSQLSTVVTVELSQYSSSLITYNAGVAIIDGQTTSSTLTYSSFSSFVSTHVLSTQDQILHYGNTQTAPAVSYDIAQAIQSDALASISWQKSFSVFSTTTKTRSINNTVGTFSTGTGSASATTSSCYGNTTMLIDVVGGTQKIAGPSQMTVYSPQGVQINNERGGWFTGAGITTSFENVDMDSTFTSSLEYVYTAKAGDNPQFSTLSPAVPTWFTLSVNSWTSVETITVSGETSTTTVGGVVEVDGEAWTVPVAVRSGIVLGGNLAQSETAVMRLDRGLYKNQDGQTSFFEGDDTTYSGTLETTYWYPVSYLEPALGIGVIGVQRNVSTWPSTTAMP